MMVLIGFILGIFAGILCTTLVGVMYMKYFAIKNEKLLRKKMDDMITDLSNDDEDE